MPAVKMALKDLAFKPNHVTARQGQTIVFVNEDDVDHQIRGSFALSVKSKVLKPGDTFELKIAKRADRTNLGF